MLLRVLHETFYEYSPGVETAQHQLHLRPLAETPCQTLLSHRLTVSPQPDQLRQGEDVYGNARDFFALHQAHESLRVQADSVVCTRPAATEAAALEQSWEAVRDRYRYKSMSAVDEAAEFTFPSPYVPRLDALTAYARPSFAAGARLVDAVDDLMARIHDDFTYESHSTDVNTPLSQALTQRKGVCQDFAHIMIGGLRSMGLPARYASGYLLTAPPPGQPRLIGCDASHAWVQVFVPHTAQAQTGGIWLDFDPTNNRRAGEDYVWLAVGRDFADVSPMRGVLHGGASHHLEVKVTVAPPDDPLWARLPAGPVPPA
ncbi:MAG: transglutaminase family protein [Comamonas sp.]